VHGDAANKEAPENASEAVQFAIPGALAKLYGTAAEELKGVLKRLDALKTELLKKADVITTAGVHAEMLARLEQRMTAVRHEIRNAQDNAERLAIDAKARAADATPKTNKSDRLAAEANTAAIAAERKLADTEAQARNKQTAEIEARANLAQMWRENAAVGGLFETAKRAHYKSGEDYAGVTRAMDSAAQRLREWKAKRERNGELVAKFGLGDWLIGPDTKDANDTWDKVYKEVHTWH
jgi:hypothetical protein